MSRTRLIRPEFFADELLSTLSDPVRLFYIGLWTLCDDAGYFECRTGQIAAALYPYRGRVARERLTGNGLAALQAVGRVEVLECAIHGTVPTLPKHGAKGGTKSDTYRSRHVTTCLSVPGRTSTDKSSSGLGLGLGLVLGLEGAQARENGGKPRGLKERLGEYHEVIAAQKKP